MASPTWRRKRLTVSLFAALIVLTGCLPADTTSPGPTAPPSSGSALAAVDKLTVKGRAPKTGYQRDLFGKGWLDVTGVGCDTRNVILQRDLHAVTFRDGSDCVVEAGTLSDPFSGQEIQFQRGSETSQVVQIDHLVALSDAWQKGAQQWDEEKRKLFANDPLNLLAVDGRLNQAKGDSDVATWLPPNKGFRCEYVAQIVAVKHHYEIWVTSAEQDTMRQVLATCPTTVLPEGGYDLAAGLGAGDGTYFRNCAHVWEELGRPITTTDPGYGKHLDRDGDGRGCVTDPR